MRRIVWLLSIGVLLVGCRQAEALYAAGMGESGEFRLVRFELPDGE